jgi:hypothetical protein
MIPDFDADGLLPPGDYEVSCDDLRQSVLVAGNGNRKGHWDAAWRTQLVDNLEVLTRQLWSVGINDIYADGSFAEDKDHPNDIDGYFVCDLGRLSSGDLQRQLNLQDPSNGMDLGPCFAQAVPRLSEEATADVASLPGRALSPCSRPRHRMRHF